MVTPRENRIHMMLSEAELTAIDDWRFKNRVATRSAAIRRLCLLALKNDPEMLPLIRAKSHLIHAVGDLLQKVEAASDPSIEDHIDKLAKVETVGTLRDPEPFAETQTLGAALSNVLTQAERLDEVVAKISSKPTKYLDGTAIIGAGVKPKAGKFDG